MRNHFKIFIFLAFCWLFLAPGRSMAQAPVTIKGVAPFAKNETIRLLVFDDLLNGVPTVVATDKIDRNGRFSLSCPLNQIKLAQLAIRTTKAEFFIVPQNTYNFEIATDTALFQLINPETYGGYLEITNTKSDTNDLNYKINRFINYYSRAMNHFGFRLTVDKNLEAYDTLTSYLNEKFKIKYAPENYYLSYIYYTVGELEKLCFPKDALRLYQKYFDNDYILYNNPAYMMLFNTCYTDYLYNSKYISKDVLTNTINEEPDYLTLFNEAGRDPMLVNERIRELVLIKNLSELTDNEEFDRGNLLKLLQYIKQSTRFPEHIPFIDNILAKHNHSITVQEHFIMKNNHGRDVEFKQFEGKDIYVHVFQSDCIACIREMMLIKEFNRLFGDNIQFISVNIDPDKKMYEQFCDQYGKLFDWPILYFNNNYDWLTEQGIVTLPDYFIINSTGQIARRYAPAPEQGLADYLQITYPNVEIEDNPLFRKR